MEKAARCQGMTRWIELILCTVVAISIVACPVLSYAEQDNTKDLSVINLL
jgi:hypothetical protein